MSRLKAVITGNTWRQHAKHLLCCFILFHWVAVDNHTESTPGPRAQTESGRWCEPNSYTLRGSSYFIQGSAWIRAYAHWPSPFWMLHRLRQGAVAAASLHLKIIAKILTAATVTVWTKQARRTAQELLFRVPCRCRQYGGDGAVERQSGPGDRSLRGDWSGYSPGTSPARHEGCRLCQECRQNRGGQFNLMSLTAVNWVGPTHRRS